MKLRSFFPSSQNADTGHAQGGDAHLESVEPDKIRVGFLAALLVALIVVLLVVGIAIRQLVWLASSEVEREVDLSQANPALVEQRSKEDAALSSYDVVDGQKGLYQIPIDRAIEIYASRSGVQPGGK